MSDSFWTGGPAAYAKGLRQEYESRLRELRSRVEKAVGEAERAGIRREIEAAKSAYETKCEQIGRLVFSRS